MQCMWQSAEIVKKKKGLSMWPTYGYSFYKWTKQFLKITILKHH